MFPWCVLLCRRLLFIVLFIRTHGNNNIKNRRSDFYEKPNETTDTANCKTRITLSLMLSFPCVRSKSKTDKSRRPNITHHGNTAVKIQIRTQVILNYCSCIIEFIKRFGENDKVRGFAEHLINFPRRAQNHDFIYHMTP